MRHSKRHRRHLFILLLRLGYIFAVYRGGILGGIAGQSPREITSITQWRESTTDYTTPLSSWSLLALSWDDGNTSFASIIANIGWSITSSSLDWLIDSTSLREQYDRNPDQTTRSTLVTTLFQEWSYDDAYSYLMSGDAMMIRSLSPAQVMLIMRNASTIIDHNHIDNEAIMTMLSRLSLTDGENRWHIALISLWQWDKQNFLTQIAWLPLTWSAAWVVGLIRQRLANVQSARDMPEYYADGMIALSLFENGYTRLAQTLSLSILADYPDYILPQQILSYSALLAHEWRESAWYFEKLLISDQHNSSSYHFFRGVSAYWLGEYESAILSFSQIETTRITSDTIRYMINSYLAFGDANGASKSFKSLLSRTDMHNADMMLAREKIVFAPYMYSQDYAILKYDASLLDLYITRCQQGWFDQTVCMIGTIARDVSQRKTANLTDRLRSINEILPRSYLSYLLAESLIRDGNIDDAKQSLIKSLSLTKDPILQEMIKKKLQSVL